MDTPHFTDHERKLVQQTLLERFGQPVPIQSVEVELQLDPPAPLLTDCPAFYWQRDGAEFVVCKAGVGDYRAQFFYGPDEIYGTGVESYDNLGDCIVSLLQVQAEHAGRAPPAAAAQAQREQPEITGDDYDGPLVI